MSITKSYNKQTDTYYAYGTTYEWSDEKQKGFSVSGVPASLTRIQAWSYPTGKPDAQATQNSPECPPKARLPKRKPTAYSLVMQRN